MAEGKIGWQGLEPRDTRTNVLLLPRSRIRR